MSVGLSPWRGGKRDVFVLVVVIAQARRCEPIGSSRQPVVEEALHVEGIVVESGAAAEARRLVKRSERAAFRLGRHRRLTLTGLGDDVDDGADRVGAVKRPL